MSGESIWAPTAVLPGAGAQWSALDEHHLTCSLTVDGHRVELHHHIDDSGALRDSTFARWGDPDNRGEWGLHPFGFEATAHRRWGSVTIPSEGQAGWHFGTDRWEAGVFFRYQITDYRLIDA